MHGLEKSDSAIVAVKPPNKAGLPVAEAVERRAGAEGNVDQQSTPRTQSRIRVTQALSRVRQAARHRKKERFTALLHHLNVDTLRTAFLALKRKAAPGVDGVRWQDYEADLERNLEDLSAEVLEVALEVRLVVLPSHPVHARSGLALEREERRAECVDVEVVEKRGEPLFLPVPCGLPYAAQRLGHAYPALGPGRALLVHVSLGPCPSLHRLRNR